MCLVDERRRNDAVPRQRTTNDVPRRRTTNDDVAADGDGLERAAAGQQARFVVEARDQATRVDER